MAKQAKQPLGAPVVRPALSRRVKELLASWPAGTSRDTNWGTDHPDGGTVERSSLDRAVATGYLTVDESGSTNTFGNSVATWTRTALPIKLAPKRMVDRPYDGVWPWSTDNHWSRICTSPTRAGIAVATKLKSYESQQHASNAIKNMFEHARTTAERMSETMYVTSKTELTGLRVMMPKLFRNDFTRPSKRRYYHYDDKMYLPVGMVNLLVSGTGLRLLCYDLMVEPEFQRTDTGWQFVRFRALDPELALERKRSLEGLGPTVADRYLDSIRRHT